MKENRDPDASSATGVSLSPPTSHAVSAQRNPWIAALASFLFPPVGHFYAGVAQRGIVIGTGRLILAAAAGLSPLALSGIPALTALVIAAIVTNLLPAIDAFAIAARGRAGFAARSYNRGSVYVAVATASLVLSLCMTALVRTQVQAFRIPSASMEPTMKIGDFLFVDKTRYRRQGPRRGDIVAYRFPADPNKLFLKRVVGLPGETLEIRAKQVFIENSPL